MSLLDDLIAALPTPGSLTAYRLPPDQPGVSVGNIDIIESLEQIFTLLQDGQHTNAGWFLTGPVTNATKTAAIQAAVNSLGFDDPTGGTVFIPWDVDLTDQILVARNGVSFVGRGGQAQGNGLVWGATKIKAPAGKWAFKFQVLDDDDNPVECFAGPAFDGIQIVDDGSAEGGLWLVAQSNFYINIPITGFTNGWAVWLDSTEADSQYGVFGPAFQGNNCATVVKNDGHNGLRFLGGMCDANSNNGTVRADSVFYAGTSGDTPRFFGTVIQYYALCFDFLVGLNPELHGVRCEGFETAILNAVPDTKVAGGSFNNSIIGGGGTVCINTASGKNLDFDPASCLSVDTVLDDSGLGTRLPNKRLAESYWDPSSDQTFAATSTSYVDVDAGLAAVRFIVPPTGVVVIEGEATVQVDGGTGMGWAVMFGGGVHANTETRVAYWGSTGFQGVVRKSWRIGGLNPGDDITFKLGFARFIGSGACEIDVGHTSDWGAMAMRVYG